jgi:hypothetical protein
VIHGQQRRPSLTLHDGTTGALLATLVAEGGAGRIAATFLRDGQLAVVESGRNVTLRTYSRDGVPSWSLDIATTFALGEVIQVAPDVLAVPLPYPGTPRRSDVVLVDASAGTVIRRESGLRPAAASWFARRGQTSADDGSLFVDDRDALVRLDIATGARKVLLGGS